MTNLKNYVVETGELTSKILAESARGAGQAALSICPGDTKLGVITLVTGDGEEPVYFLTEALLRRELPEFMGEEK